MDKEYYVLYVLQIIIVLIVTCNLKENGISFCLTENVYVRFIGGTVYRNQGRNQRGARGLPQQKMFL